MPASRSRAITSHMSRCGPRFYGRIQPVVATPADSTGRRVACRGLRRGCASRGFAGSVVEFGGDVVEVLGAVHGQVGALGEVLAQQPVGVLVGAALPGRVRVAEVDRAGRWRRRSGRGRPSPCPGPRSASGAACAGSSAHRGDHRRRRPRRRRGRRAGAAASRSGWCARPGCRSPSSLAVPDDQVAFPVPGHRPVLDLGGPLADVDHVRDPAPAARRRARRGLRSARPVRRHWSARGAARRGPARTATGRSSRATPASPDRRGSPRRSRRAICSGLWFAFNRVCHLSPQRQAGRQPRRFGSTSPLVGVGLGDRGPVAGRCGRSGCAAPGAAPG